MKGFLKSTVVFLMAALALLTSSCREPEKVPPALLTQDQMVKALAEIYIGEEKVSRLGLSRDSAAMVFNEYKSRIFSDMGISDSVFRSSHDYYIDHPLEMEKIYSVLIDSLQLREQRAPFKTEYGVN